MGFGERSFCERLDGARWRFDGGGRYCSRVWLLKDAIFDLWCWLLGGNWVTGKLAHIHLCMAILHGFVPLKYGCDFWYGVQGHTLNDCIYIAI